MSKTLVSIIGVSNLLKDPLKFNPIIVELRQNNT